MIAFDVASNSGSATVSPVQWNHTCVAGANLLVVCVGLRGNQASEAVSGITYNGVALTLAEADENTTAVNGARCETWFLLAPATGSALQISVTITGTWTEAVAVALSFSGAVQSGQPDAHVGKGEVTNTTNISQAITTVANNCLVINAMRLGSSPTTLAPGAGTVPANGSFKGTNLQVAVAYNVPITPAGLDTESWSWTPGNTSKAVNVVSFSPIVSVLSYDQDKLRSASQSVKRASVF